MEMLNRNDKNFPSPLRRISPKVSRLFYKGRYSKKIFDKSLAVVGSRRMTKYGREIIKSIIPPLVNENITIISGFMYGVDQEAHKVALENGGKTVAVLGWGIDWPVGPSDQVIYSDIEDKGLIISEYPDKTAPRLWMFPRRNRIMAGLASGVLVIEAAPGSGSLITASYAASYKKPLFALPGPVTSSVSLGTNNLIRDGQARLVTSALDILAFMGWRTMPSPGLIKTEDGNSDLILKLLSNEALTADEIAVSLGLSVEKINTRLSLLQISGSIEESEGKFSVKLH